LIPIDSVEEGLALLDERERRRLVKSWTDRYPDRWAAVVRTVGDRAIAERALLASAVRAAIGDRRPRPLAVLALLEPGDLGRSPGAALALVLSPGHVWSYEDALAAEAAAGKPGRDLAAWFRTVDDVALARMTPAHAQRLRLAAARLASQLPVPRLPNASAILARACEEVERDAGFARGVACGLLATYVRHISESSQRSRKAT
jgi:hypothetical protein